MKRCKDRIFESNQSGKRYVARDTGLDFESSEAVNVPDNNGMLYRDDGSDGASSNVWKHSTEYYALSRFGILFELQDY